MHKSLVPRKVFINPVFKDKVTVLKTSKETGGVYSMGELEVSPGGGNPMHTHTTFEETFTAVRGRLGVNLDGKKIHLEPGQSITIPRRTKHHFFNDGNETIVCHVRFDPGNEDFVKGLAIAYGLAADGKTTKEGIPKKLMHLALMVVLMDTRPTGGLGLLFPLLKWMAARGRRTGVLAELLGRYYYQ